MTEMDREYVDLAHEIAKLADNTDGHEKHVVSAMSYQVKAIGDLDAQVEVLNKSIKELNKATTGLMRRQIWLIVVQTVAAVLLGWAAIQISK